MKKTPYRIILLVFALIFSAGAGAFTVDTRSATGAPMTGLWWNHNEPGWGMSLEQQGPIIFMGWYTYDNNGNSTRYYMSDCVVSVSSCSGTINYIAGGAAPTAAWTGRPPSSVVGSGTITFSDANSGVFNFVLNGVAGSKNIERMVFAAQSPAPPIEFTGLWWNPDESGWGVFFEHQSAMIFAAFYAFDTGGFPVRYVASNCAVTGSAAVGYSCTGMLYRTGGGKAPTMPWTGTVSQTTAGTLTVRFVDSANAVMTFDIDGQSGTKNVTRMSFWTGIPVSTYTDLGRQANFNAVNASMIAYGLTPYTQNAALDQAAQAHSQSAVVASSNPVVSRTEVASQPGYTGVTPLNRAAAAGYLAALSDEVVGAPTAIDAAAAAVAALNEFLAGPYHRHALLGTLRDVGIGQAPFKTQYSTSTYFYTTIDTAVANGQTERVPPADWVGLWPVDRATDVMFAGALESPNPIPANNGACAGYPVSVRVGISSTILNTIGFTLAETATGAPVSVQLSTYATDANQSQTSPNTAYIIPFKPLRLATQYTAHFVGSSSAGPIDKTWYFTTTTQNDHTYFGCNPS